MRFIKIQTATGSEEILNADQITSITKEASTIVINLSSGAMIRTKFTDLDHAVDFIQRASQSFNLTI